MQTGGPWGVEMDSRSIFGKSLRRHTVDQLLAMAKDPKTDANLKGQIVEHVKDTALGSSVYGRLVYRFIAIALGLVALLVVIFAFALLAGGHKVDSAFYTLGSAAVGALGGVFAPQGAAPANQPNAPAHVGPQAGPPGPNVPAPAVPAAPGDPQAPGGDAADGGSAL
jgi:hypothetical protein